MSYVEKSSYLCIFKLHIIMTLLRHKKKVCTCALLALAIAAFTGCKPDDSVENGDTGQTPSVADDDGNSEGQELMKNGGLENWMDDTTYDIPVDWLVHKNHNVKKDGNVVLEGHLSAKMMSQQTGSTARIDQRMAVFPGQKIRIRFHYFVEQWKTNGARTYCYFRTRAAESSNIAADELKSFYGKEAYYIIRGGGYGLAYLPHETAVWQEFDETIEVPPTANYFVFGINSYHGTTLYVDDCSVDDVGE